MVSHGSALGGSPISALNIGKYIDKQKFEIIYLFGEEGAVAQWARREGFKVYISPKRGFLSLPLVWDSWKILTREKIDILHLNTLTPYYKYPAIAGKLKGVPTIWFIREDPKSRRSFRLYPYLRRFADRVVTVSYDTRAHLPPEIKNSGKVETIYNGIDPDFCKGWSREKGLKLLKLPGEFKYLTTIASLEERKGVIELVEGFLEAKLPEKYKLLVVGRDRSSSQNYYKKLKKRVEEKGQGRVILYGESSQIPAVLAISEMFLLYSQWEGLARTILEAMACGKPILASNRGGNREQVQEGVNGLLVEWGNRRELVKKLKEIPFLNLKAMGKASFQLLKEQFDIKVTTKKIERSYIELLERVARKK